MEKNTYIYIKYKNTKKVQSRPRMKEERIEIWKKKK